MSDITALQYLGYERDQGGIVSIVRTLAATRQFVCVLGVNPGFAQRRHPPLPIHELPAIAGETLDLRTFWRARAVAAAARAWLAEDPHRVFHGHSRAGLAVALWLNRSREKRVVASVHCYGKQRWFYRWAARRLKDGLFWLSPAMKRYYGIADRGGWAQCIPGCVALPQSTAPAPGRRAQPLRVVRLAGIGSLVPIKRWHLVLDALHALPASVRAKYRFFHIGASDGTVASERYVRALRVQTAALGLDRIVEWLGERPASDDFLREMDCLVIATHREAFSISMLEALALGVPVLAANSGGARDVIVPSRNGWLYTSGDPRDLARMLTMLAESDALETISVNPEEIRQFSAPVIAADWFRVYCRLIGTATR